MAVLIRPKRWGRTKPTTGAQIDWGHPLAKGLFVCLPMNEGAGRPIERVYGNGLAAHVNGQGNYKGDGIDYTGTLGSSLPSLPAAYQRGWPISIAVGVDWMGTPTSANDGLFGLIATTDNTSPFVSCAWVITSSGGSVAIAANSAGTALFPMSGSGVGSPTGTGKHYLACMQSGDQRFYNGGTQTGTGTAALSTPTYPSAQLAVGNYTGISRDSAVRVRYGYMWNRMLTSSEAEWLAAEPYAFFHAQSPRRSLWVPAPSTVLFTVTVTPSLTTTTTLSRSVAHSLSASLSGAASCVRGVGHTLAASVSTSSSLARVVSKPLPLTSTTTASVSRAMSRNVAASLSTTATAVRTVRHALSASLATSTLVSFVGASVRNITIVSRTIASQLVSATRSRLRSSTRPSVFTSKTKP